GAFTGVLGLLGLTSTGATAASGGATAAGAASAPVIDYQRVVADTAAGIQRGAQATIDASLLTKETILDCIAWALAKMIWKAVAASVIDWINSGFNGNPSFIQDIGKFMTGIADQAVG